MSSNKTYIPPVDSKTRAINNLSMLLDKKFNNIITRIEALEKRQAPFFQHHTHSYATPQTFTTSASYTTLCSMTVDQTKGAGDSYNVIGVVDCEFPSSGVFELKLTDGVDTLYEAVDLERLGHGGEVLMGVHKPVEGPALTYYIQARRASGTGNITYVSHGIFVIRGWSAAGE